MSVSFSSEHVWLSCHAVGVVRIFSRSLACKVVDRNVATSITTIVSLFPVDHAAVRLVIHKPANREQQGKRIPTWMCKPPVLCSVLKRLHDDHRYLPIHVAHLRNSKLLLMTRPKSRQFVSPHGRHLTAWEQSSSSPLLHCVPTEMDILGRSCDVVRHGSPLKIALTRSLLNVWTSRGSVRSLQILLVKSR